MSIIIQNTGGGYRTKDATALPENVENGKVFYNAAGRQVGTGVFKKEKSVIAINNGSYKVGTNYGTKANYSEEDGRIWTNGGQTTGFFNEKVPSKTAKCKLFLPTDINILITGWKINGIKNNLYPPIGNMFEDGVTIGYGYNAVKFCIYWQDANYTNGSKMGWYIDDVRNYSIEIFYLEME